MTEKEKQELIEKLKRFIRPLKKAGKVAGVYALLNFCAPSAQAQTSYLPDKDPTKITQTDYTPKTRTIKVQIDTVGDREKTYTAKTSPSKGIIIINYNPKWSYLNQHSLSPEVLIHEAAHLRHFQSGAYDYAVSPKQAFKRGKYEEISVNIEVLLHRRNIYLQTGDMSVFRGYEFYEKGIKEGIINPHSTSVEDFTKEMEFIFNETKNFWLAVNNELAYKEETTSKISEFGDFSEEYKNFWDENYEESLNKIFTIAGVNFWQFHDGKDVEIPADVQKGINDTKSKTPKKPPSTVNRPIHRQNIAREPHYIPHSATRKISNPVSVEVPIVTIDIPEGFHQGKPQIEEQQPMPQQQENVVDTKKSGKKKKEKKQNGWNEFWEKVGDFFRPSWKQKTDKSPAPAAKPTTAPKPAPVTKPAPKAKPAPAVPQNTVVDTLSQQNQVTENISEPKSKWREFWEKTGDFFRPSWKQKPEKKTTVSQTTSPALKAEPTPAPTPVAKSVPQPEQTSKPTPQAEQKAEPASAPDTTTATEQTASPAPEQVETTNRISSGKDRAVRMHNKLKAKVIKEKKDKYQKDQNKQQRKEQRKSREYNRIKQQVEKAKAKS